MANKIITIEIATLIKAALSKVVANIIDQVNVAVYADGVADNPSPNGDQVVMPLVSVVVSECNPQQYKSRLREYPFTIEVNTWYPDDNAQINLYTISHAVSQWLMSPSLPLTLAHFDSMVINDAPERTTDGRLRSSDERVQGMRWNGLIHTRKVIT